jgi:hypothetical protein
VGHVSRAPGASAPGAMAARAPATIAPTAGSPPANDRCLLGVSPLVYGASCVPPGASRGRWVSRAAPVSGGAGGSAMPLSPTRQLVTSRERSKPTRCIMPPASKVKLQTEEKSPWDGDHTVAASSVNRVEAMMRKTGPPSWRGSAVKEQWWCRVCGMILSRRSSRPPTSLSARAVASLRTRRVAIGRCRATSMGTSITPRRKTRGGGA